MSETRSGTKKGLRNKPYASDLEYLQDELEWVEERARRILDETMLVRIEAGEEVDDFPVRGRSEDLPSPRVLRSRAERHRKLEEAARVIIDHRLEVTRQAGISLALDRLCAGHGLDEFDRTIVLERWGIGAHLTYGKGVSALFHGPPGTGKTLCAEAISCEQNLARLFQEARRNNSVLFLDEADTLLMERGEVDDVAGAKRPVGFSAPTIDA